MSAILTTIQDNSMQWLALGADAAIKGLVLLARTATARWFSLRFALATAIIVSTVMPLAYAGPTANGDKSVASADNADISKEDPANSFQQKAELATPPEKAIVIDPHMPWVSRGDWAHELKTDITVMDTKKGYSRFIVGAAGKRHIWNKTLDAPIDRKRYSTLVMTYRARNAGDLHDVVWLNDGSGDDGNGFAAIDCKELISDGQVHVIRKDLAKRSSQNQIKGIAMVLHCGKKAPAELELIDLRFEAPDDLRASVAIKEGEPISVNVIDAKGNPVQGAKVTVDPERINWSRSALTDASGHAKVRPLEYGVSKHRLRISKATMVTIDAGDRQTSELPDEVTLFTAMHYGGVVQDEQGRAIEGAIVWLLLEYQHKRLRSQTDPSHISMITDAEGRWQTPPLPAGIQSASALLNHPDFLSDSIFRRSLRADNLRSSATVMVMKRGVPVEGFVTDSDGKAIAGATIRQGESRFSRSPEETQTDDQGHFRFPQAKTGEMILTIQKDGFSPELTQTQITGDIKLLRFQMSKGHTIRGRLVDVEGRPVADARVIADDWRGRRTLSWQTTTDEQGRFKWTSAPDDPVKFDILKQGYMNLRGQSLSASDKEYVLTMLQPLRVFGRVTDAETGKVITNITMIAGIDWGRGGSPYWERRNAKHFNNGEYETTFTFPRAGHFIRVEADGYLPGVSRSITDEEGSAEIDFKLKKGKGISGVIIGLDGKPLAEASVILCTPSTDAYIQNGEAKNYSDAPTVTTGDDGKYSFPPQTAPYALVVLHETGYVEASEDDLFASGRIVLEPWGKIEGRLLVGARGASGQRITFWQHRLGGRNQPRIYHDIKTTTGADGRFVLDRLPPGQGGVSHNVQISERSWGNSRQEWVTIEAGKTVEVTLGGTGRPVTGKISLPAEASNISLAGAQGSIRTGVPAHLKRQPMPDNWNQMDQAAQRQWRKNWLNSDEGKAYTKAAEEIGDKMKYFSFYVGQDGSFRAEDIPAGEYHLRLLVYEGGMSSRRHTPKAQLTHSFIIPEMPGGRSDKPLDLDTLQLELQQQSSGGSVSGIVGTSRPATNATTAEPAAVKLTGKPLPKLNSLMTGVDAEDMKDKPVLVCFWDKDQKPSRHCVKELAAAAKNLAAKNVAVVLVHARAADAAKLKAWLTRNKVPFPCGCVPAGKEKATLAQWCVGGQPWLVLTDATHKVKAEGFGVAELSAKLAASE